MDNLSIYVKMFNDRVRVMNQTNSPNLVLTAQDARNLHADVFNLLTHIAELSDKLENQNEVVEIQMDGGSFS